MVCRVYDLLIMLRINGFIVNHMLLFHKSPRFIHLSSVFAAFLQPFTKYAAACCPISEMYRGSPFPHYWVGVFTPAAMPSLDPRSPDLIVGL